jgi:CIC family chloride channel protein
MIALKLPQVMGAGYPAIDQALHGDFTWRLLLLLAAAKILATSFSFISGTPGGMFAPTLFIGAMIGGAVGDLEVHFFHQLAGSEAAFALVGMGTLFAGFLRTPITSVFMVVEITGNYSIILPVMVSNFLAYFIARHYQPVPLFHMASRLADHLEVEIVMGLTGQGISAHPARSGAADVWCALNPMRKALA